MAVDDTGPGEQKQNDEESETPSSTTWNETKDLTDPKLLEDKNTNIIRLLFNFISFWSGENI